MINVGGAERLRRAIPKLRANKGQCNLSSSVRCNALNRAYEALKQGVQLKHLLLEDGRELVNIPILFCGCPLDVTLLLSPALTHRPC